MADTGVKAEENSDVPPAADHTTTEVKQQTTEESNRDMRAVVLTSYGGLKGIRVMNKLEPSLSDGEVLIRVKCW